MVATSIDDSRRTIEKLYDFAQKVGYTPETYLAQYEIRWDFFPTKHGQVLYYSTALTAEQLQQSIDIISLTKELPFNSDGYDLFSINYSTQRVLTIDGIDDSSDRISTPEPLAYRWDFIHEGEFITITLYQIAGDGNKYELDGMLIDQNIVTILLQTD